MSPTGYTAILEEKPETTFREFALRCARAFGALVEMRDDPLDAPVPETIEPSPYHRDQLCEAEEELRRLKNMTPAEIGAFGKERIARSLDCHAALVTEYAAKSEAYDSMKRQVTAWDAPKALIALRSFMLEQLSLGEPWPPGEVQVKSPFEVWDDAVKSAEYMVKYHKDEWIKEQARAADRTAWLKALRESLDAMEAVA